MTLGFDEIVAPQILADPGLIESLAFETWQTIPVQEQELRLEGREVASSTQRMALQELQEFESRHYAFFNHLNDLYAENMNFAYSSQQWTEKEIQAISDKGLNPYVNNTMRRFMLTMLGERMGGKKEWRAYGRMDADQMKAHVASHILRYFHRKNEWHLRSQYIYRDGMVGNRGFGAARLDHRDPFGNILCERFRPEEFMWDIYSTLDPRFEGTKNMWRSYYVPRAQIAVEFPEWAEMFRGMRFTSESKHEKNLNTLIQPRLSATYEDPADRPTFSSTRGYWDDLVRKTEFYRRRQELKYRVYDGYRKTYADFTDKSQAQDYTQSLTEYYVANFALQGIQIETVAVSEPHQAWVDVIDQLIWAGETLLRVNAGGERFPYHMFCPEWRDGEIASFFQHGKDHQRLINRMLIRLDESAGKAKGKLWYNNRFLDPNVTPEEHEAKLVSHDPVGVYLPPGVSWDEAVHVTGMPPAGEHFVQMMLDISLQGQQQMFGGLNTIGQTEASQESGIAIQARQTAASLALIPYMEEFDRFDQRIGEDVLHLSQFIDPTVQLMTLDDAGNPEYRAIIEDGIQTIGEHNFQVEIQEVSATPTERYRRLTTMLSFVQQFPEYGRAAAGTILKNADIDPADAKRMEEEFRNQQERQYQMEERAQQHKEDLERAKLELDIKRVELKEREVAVLEKNPPKVVYAIKNEGTPSIVAEVLNHSGEYDADPSGVASDMALGAIMRQDALDLQQKRRNEGLLPEEREAMKTKAKQPYRNVPKAEDSGARSSK